MEWWGYILLGVCLILAWYLLTIFVALALPLDLSISSFIHKGLKDIINPKFLYKMKPAIREISKDIADGVTNAYEINKSEGVSNGIGEKYKWAVAHSIRVTRNIALYLLEGESSLPPSFNPEQDGEIEILKKHGITHELYKMFINK